MMDSDSTRKNSNSSRLLNNKKFSNYFNLNSKSRNNKFVSINMTNLKSNTFNENISKFSSKLKNLETPMLIKNNSTEGRSPIKIKLNNMNLKNSKVNKSMEEIKENYAKCSENCASKLTLRKYERILKELMIENEKLKTINEFFMKSINNKDEYMLRLFKQNTQLSLEINQLIKKREIESKNTIKTKITIDCKSNKDKEIVTTYSNEDDKNSINKRPLQKRTNTIFPEKNNPKSNHYQDIIENVSKKFKKQIKSLNMQSSYLSCSTERINQQISQDIFKEISKLTSNDDEFINGMRNYPDDKLLMICDSISRLIQDYKYSINLIKRIKSFLQVSTRVVNTSILEEAMQMLIKNSMEILECDRTTIFVHEKITNMLVVHHGLGVLKGAWKVPPDKGIVGWVFTKGIKQKLDDVYLDERFNREIDIKTGYKTTTMLCVPLKDEKGECFAVIQALNKKNNLVFTVDDEELMDVFATQACAILKNSMKFDENASFSSRLKKIINFSIHVQICSNLIEFTQMAEQLLASFWNTNVSQILILTEKTFKPGNGINTKTTNDVEIVLKHFKSLTEIEEKPVNLGIVGRVFSRKELIAVNNNNHYFNSIVDIESGLPLITFPIFDYPVETKIIAIGQLCYSSKILESNRLNENDSIVIEFFSNISSKWLTNYYNTIKTDY